VDIGDWRVSLFYPFISDSVSFDAFKIGMVCGCCSQCPAHFCSLCMKYLRYLHGHSLLVYWYWFNLSFIPMYPLWFDKMQFLCSDLSLFCSLLCCSVVRGTFRCVKPLANDCRRVGIFLMEKLLQSV
jgi:hypothetical protein